MPTLICIMIGFIIFYAVIEIYLRVVNRKNLKVLEYYDNCYIPHHVYGIAILLSVVIPFLLWSWGR